VDDIQGVMEVGELVDAALGVSTDARLSRSRHCQTPTNGKASTPRAMLSNCAQEHAAACYRS